ncbi:MAG: hypothetical protein A2W25_06190 [candidate division Zixibacteria bacterium RBG_16_53_22]|nr:MAG: hypothetical protein A2W25_06190 [candidate division Zixibacteria bacterium RBG_16_53_22]
MERKTRRKFSTDEKIRIVLEGLKGEASIAKLCRREGIIPNLYYRWSKAFLEAGKKRLKGDTERGANTSKTAAQSGRWHQPLLGRAMRPDLESSNAGQNRRGGDGQKYQRTHN